VIGSQDTVNKFVAYTDSNGTLGWYRRNYVDAQLNAKQATISNIADTSKYVEYPDSGSSIGWYRRAMVDAKVNAKADLTGAIFTGQLGSSSELLVDVEEAVNWAGEYYVRLDAASFPVTLNVAGGNDGEQVIIKAINIDNGATVVGEFDGITDYSFTVANECIIIKYSSTGGRWEIISKYTP